MSESRKFYNKGVKDFHKGNLEKAIANLDLAISHDIKNSAALNLRGIIYYIKGQSVKALTSWQINVEFNNDEIAKGHIESFEEDKKYLEKYNDAFDKMNKGRFNESTRLLEELTDSDFNILNVRNALAYSYIKEGKYTKAKECIEIVLEKHKTNEGARDNIDILKHKSGISVKTGDNKKLYIGALCTVLVLGVGVTGVNNSKKISNIGESSASIVSNEEEKKDKEMQKDTLNTGANVTEKEDEIVKVSGLDGKKLKDAIDKKDFDLIGKTLKTTKIDGLSGLELDVVNEAKKVMQTEGIKELYKKGTTEFNVKNFGKAKDKFLMALDYSKETYLDAHITYMLSVTYENLEENDNAIKYYSKYESTNYQEEGSYREEVLYKLAILNEDKSIEESKKFAKKLVNEYSNSIYNNDNIKAILNN
ncbi:MAG: hypothetical protein ACRCTZ_17210 [Sarcina sp.]